MDSDEDSDHANDWTQLDSVKTFEWVDNSPSPISNILNESHGYSMDPEHFDSSTKLMDNTPSVKENNFIEQLTATKASAPISLLVESLLQQLCSMIEPNRESADHLYTTICQHLHRMNLIDETFKMGEFDVMRSQYQRALYQLVVARGQTENTLNQSVWPLSDSTGKQWSRYHREFDELNFVAGGGFGRVYRVRNKLDGSEYAVKKVNIKYRTINRVLPRLAEVKTFACLNHHNIVPYKAAWLEPLFDDSSTTVSSVIDARHIPKTPQANGKRKKHGKKSSKNTTMSKEFRVKIFDIDSKLDGMTNFDDDETDSESESSESDEEKQPSDQRNKLQLPPNNRADESSDFIQFQRGTHDDVVDGANMSSAMESPHDKRLCKPNENRPNNNFIQGNLDFNESRPHLKLKWATLYIQMSFRPLTLRSWIDERNKNDDFNTFYRQFMEKSVQQWDRPIIEEEKDDSLNENTSTGAIAKFSDQSNRTRLLSSQSNPSFRRSLSKTWDPLTVILNIFTQALSGLRYIHLENIVHHDIKPSNIFIGCEKNGDLYVQLGDFGLACPLHAKHSPEGMIGTITYAAPEQLKGHCNEKSDIYSLGIILLELLIPFNTDMERLKTIEAARKGKFPENIPPKFLTLLKTLLDKPTKRPNAVQTFELLSKLELWNGYDDGKQEKSSQRNDELQHQLSQITDELKKLKMQLAFPKSNDSSNGANSDISNVIDSIDESINENIKIQSRETASSKTLSVTYSSYEKTIENQTSSFSLDVFDENEDKDRQIRVLSNKLIESDKETNELKKEIERLRDIINQRNGSKTP